jgi:hypothetical protein
MIMVMVMVMVIVVMIMIAVRTAGVVGMVVIEEMRVVFEGTAEIEGTAVQHGVERDSGAFGAVNAGRRIDRPHRALDGLQLFRRDKIGLVQQNDVGKGDLVFGFSGCPSALSGRCSRVHQRHNSVEPCLLARTSSSMKKGLRHRRRDRRGLSSPRRWRRSGPAGASAPRRHAHQVAAHRAAHAAIVHFVDFLVGFDDQIVVDADLAELVDDHRIALAMRSSDRMRLSKRRLAGSRDNRSAR